MIHTDGKPTIANTRLVPVCNTMPGDLYPGNQSGRTCLLPRGHSGMHSWENPDADSMPGGYDNPQESYDWNGED